MTYVATLAQCKGRPCSALHSLVNPLPDAPHTADLLPVGTSVRTTANEAAAVALWRNRSPVQHSTSALLSGSQVRQRSPHQLINQQQRLTASSTACAPIYPPAGSSQSQKQGCSCWPQAVGAEPTKPCSACVTPWTCQHQHSTMRATRCWHPGQPASRGSGGRPGCCAA